MTTVREELKNTRDIELSINNILANNDPVPVVVVNNKTDNPCYDIRRCELLYDSMCKFLEKNNMQHVNVDCINPLKDRVIYNIIDKKYYRYDRMTCEKIFVDLSVTGHAFAIPTEYQYVIPLIIDLDCKKCKSIMPCDDLPFVFCDSINNFVHPIDQIVIGIFPNKNFKRRIMKNQNKCNLHIYYDVQVTVLLYREIIKCIRAKLDNVVIDKYSVDLPSFLPLPFSSKYDGNIYRDISVNEEVTFWTNDDFLFSHNQYHDLLFEFDNGNPTSCNVLGTIVYNDYHFVTSNINIGCNENFMVNQINVKLHYRMDEEKDTPKVGEFEKTIPFEKYRNKLCEYKENVSAEMKTDTVVKCLNRVLKFNYYMHSLLKSNDDKNESVINNNSDYVKEIYPAIKDNAAFPFLKNICTCLCEKEHAENDDFLVHFMKFMSFPNNSFAYSFYILISLIMCMRKLNEVDTKSVITDVCDLLSAYTEDERFVCLTDQKYKDTLLVVSNKNNIEDVSVEMMQYLITEYKIFTKANGDPIKYYMSTTLDMESFMMAYISYMYPVMKFGDDIYKYSKSKGIYIKTNEKGFRKRDTYAGQEITENLINALHKYIEYVNRDEGNQDDRSDRIDVHAVVESTKCHYLNMVKNVRITNWYNFFISTEYGVFNTMLGCYMPHMPMLYFTTKKDFCLVTSSFQKRYKTIDFSQHNSTALITELNASVKTERCKYSDMYNALVYTTEESFYNEIMLPSLLAVEDCLYTDEDAKIMFRICCEKLILFPIKCQLPSSTAETCRSWDKEFSPKRRLEQLSFETLSGVDYERLCKNYVRHAIDRNHNLLSFMNLEFMEKHIDDTKVYTTKIHIPEHLDLNHIMVINIFIILYGSCRKLYNSKRHFPNLNYRLPEAPRSSVTTCAQDLYHTVRHIMNMFSYDKDIIIDFLNCMSQLYTHMQSRKKFVIFSGPFGTGKTTLISSIIKTASNSTMSIPDFKNYTGDTLNAPTLIKMNNSYIIQCPELEKIETSCLKTMCGNDEQMRRMNHSNEFIKLRNISVMFGSTNCVPETARIDSVDEAVRDRLAIIPLENKLTVTEENRLYMFANKKVPIDKSIDEDSQSIVLSNLFYEAFVRRQNSSEGLSETCKIVLYSEKIKNAINEFMIANSMCYTLLNRCDIKINPDYKITEEELMDSISVEVNNIMADNEKKRKRPDKYLFRKKFKTMFNERDQTYYGMGVSSSRNNIITGFQIGSYVEHCPGNSVSVSQLKIRIANSTDYDIHNINNSIEIFLRGKNVVGDKLIDYKYIQ